MNSVLVDLGYLKNPSFQDVFNTKLSQKVVAGYWTKLIKDRNIGLFSIDITIKDKLQTLFLADKELKPKQAIYLLGLFEVARDRNGMRELRTIVSKRSHDRTWYRLAKDMQTAGELITKNKLRNWVTQIDNALAEYEPYKQPERR